MTADPANPDDRPILLIVGTPATGRRALLRRLIAESTGPIGAPGGNVSDELTLDNKYYTARVRVSLATPQLLPDSAAVGDHEAQLLLFDATSEASFDAVRDWAHRSGCEEGGDCEPEIKLCVAAVTDALPRDGDAEVQRPPWLEASRQWASDNLYEYVEVTSASTNATKETSRGPDGGRQGIARILEALQAHAWPGLRRKTPPPVGRALRTAPAEQLPPRVPDQQCEVSADQRTVNGAAGTAEPAAADGLQHGANVLAFREFLSSDDATPGVTPLDDEDESEKRFDQLMATFAGSRQRLQQLPDSQRREAAERMALQMMEAFGLEDAGESDDSDS